MKKYYVKLVVLTLVLVLVAFCLLWFKPQYFLVAMPLAVLYFSVVTGLQHYVIVSSAMKDPRTFVKNFLGITVGVLFLHLIVLAIYMFTHLATAKLFVIAFSILYVVYLAFETIELSAFVRKQKNG